MNQKKDDKLFMTVNKPNQWCVYLFYNKKRNKTYLGCTSDIKRREKQHNGKLKGGAKNTKLKHRSTDTNDRWILKGLITGEMNRSTSGKLESKIRKSKIYGLENRLLKMESEAEELEHMFDRFNEEDHHIQSS